MHALASACTCVIMPLEARYAGSPGAEVKGSCEPLDVVAEHSTQHELQSHHSNPCYFSEELSY